MPEPQSTLFFLLLIAVFGALVWWLVVAKQLVFRVLAACLAFVPAMMFGVAAVNKYYDYYQNWNAAISDMTNQGVRAAQVPTVSSRSGDRFGRFLGQTIDSQLAAQQGYTLLLTVHGRDSHLTRPVFVFLPPQYFWPGRYHTYRFPVIELLHGFPGNPQDWITVLGVNSLLDRLDKQHRADPAVLVMPAVNGPRGQSLQCLNQVNGPQDDTFMAGDLPRYIARVLRVQAPGVGWGVAGYSEGGFCAANLSLQHPNVFSSAGVLSGYFYPSDNQLVDPVREVSPFGGNRQLARLNAPMDLLQSLPAGQVLPQFWLGAGMLDRGDVRSAQVFAQLLELRQPNVTLKFVPGGGHTAFTWRTLLPPMLQWMTAGLAHDIVVHDAQAALQRRLARERAAARARHSRKPKAAPSKPKPAPSRSPRPGQTRAA